MVQCEGFSSIKGGSIRLELTEYSSSHYPFSKAVQENLTPNLCSFSGYKDMFGMFFANRSPKSYTLAL